MGLAVAGAFHSPLMQPASDRLAAALEGVEISEPASRSTPTSRRARSAPANWSPPSSTRWSPRSVRGDAREDGGGGHDTFVHVGPGDVTAGLARRTVKGSNVVTVSSLDDVGVAVEALGSIS